ncbi:MAG: plasmid pRiA4b ORF-3 family protein [Butyrivibrio sp.]|nr:plasmid pRiA4b ORF-3 family protein [Butyrivibrio sp.]
MGKQYTLKVYPAGMSRTIYRVLQISGKETLDSLCSLIISSFDFIDEHLYEFCMDNRMYSDCSFQSDPEYGEPSTKIALDKLGLVKGQNFSLHYDFGDDWMFTIHVQKIEKEEKKTIPVILKAKGEIEQYPSWDEDDEEWE